MSFPSITRQGFDILRQVEGLSLRPDPDKAPKKKTIETFKNRNSSSVDSASFDPKTVGNLQVKGAKFPLIERTLTKKPKHEDPENEEFLKEFQGLFKKYSNIQSISHDHRKIELIRQILQQNLGRK